MKNKGFISLIVFCFCLIIVSITHTFLFAETITIDITAEVSYVDDIGNTLGGAVEVGDIISGQYTYESTTPDTNPLPTVGDYLHYTSPYGISLEVNGLIFKTDYANVNFLVEIVNDHAPGIPPCDNYLLRSYNNLSLSGGIVVEHISWQLDDPTATALSSEALPVDPPVLDDWQSIFGISITGFIPDSDFPYITLPGTEYFIRAHVSSATIAYPEIIVTIDIKPGSFPNFINFKNKGNIPVAILSDSDFDAGSIDQNTVLFAGASSLSKGKSLEDVNGDGLLDIVFHFNSQNLNLQVGDTSACLIGKTIGGQNLKGSDSVYIVK